MRRAFLAAVALVMAAILVFALRSALAERPDDLGAEAGRLAECPDRPNCVSSQAEDGEHRVEPLPLAGDPETAMERWRGAVESMARTRVVTFDPGRYLHAESTSLIFRFVDDLELLADPAEGVVHVRSASRVGHSDLGVNRRRVEELRRRGAEGAR